MNTPTAVTHRLDDSLPALLQTVTEQRRNQARRDQWRRHAGTDGNGHAQRYTYEQDPTP